MFRLDQKGVSLPLVLAILGLVIANTYYFMDVEKNTKEQNIKRGAEMVDNSEKIRLASFLSDVNVCSSTGVFKDKTISVINTPPLPGQPVIPLKKGLYNFLESAVQTGPPTDPKFKPLYGRGSLKLLRYEILAKPQPAAPAPLIPNEKLYYLNVTYSIIDRSILQQETGKTKVIRLPLYIVFNAGNPTGNIETCFTEADEGLNTVTNAVTASCKGDTALLVDDGLIECQHEQTNQVCSGSEALDGINFDPTTHKQGYTCAFPKNVGGTAGTYCSTTPMMELLVELQSDDKFVCGTTDTGCEGKMFVMGPASAPNCVTTCAVDQLFKSVNSAGTSTCIPRPKQCPVGKYTRTITANGDITCESYTVLDKTCSVGKVATEVDPTLDSSVSGDAALGCRDITKDKVCPGVTAETTFVQSFATVTPTCKTF